MTSKTPPRGDRGRGHAFMESAPGRSDAMVPGGVSAGAAFEPGDRIAVEAVPCLSTTNGGQAIRYKATRILKCRSAAP